MDRQVNYFKVYFPRDNTVLFDVISQLMCVLTMIIYARYIVGLPGTGSLSPYWVVVLAMIIYLVWKYWQRSHGRVVSYSPALAVSAIIFFFIAGGSSLINGIALIYVLTAFIERYVKASLEIEFDEDEVVIKRLFTQHKPWKFIDNVILKDGMLTIDYKNNKIFQKEVADDVSPELEKEFNEFCRSQLRLHAKEAMTQ